MSSGGGIVCRVMRKRSAVRSGLAYAFSPNVGSSIMPGVKRMREMRYRRELALDQDEALGDALAALRVEKGFLSETEMIRYVLHAALPVIAKSEPKA